jgi:hypothetical protein
MIVVSRPLDVVVLVVLVVVVARIENAVAKLLLRPNEAGGHC